MEGERHGLVAGLAVALGGGILFVVLLALFLGGLGDSDSSTTVTVTAAAAASTTGDAGTTGTATTTGTTVASLAPDVVAGASTFRSFACGACHGLSGQGGVNPAIPALTGAGQEFTAAQLRKIIDKGAGVVSDPTAPFMPVWGPVISDTQVDQLVAYIKAGLPTVPGSQPDAVPTGASPQVAGQTLYVSYGCINCHGPNGLGGVPNPGSEDKAVPPLSGADFRGEFDTPAKIKEMIMGGSVIGKAPIASMRHWGGVLTDEQTNDLVAYIQSFK
jgi:mono/diheme cytochrome c family protein